MTKGDKNDQYSIGDYRTYFRSQPAPDLDSENAVFKGAVRGRPLLSFCVIYSLAETAQQIKAEMMQSAKETISGLHSLTDYRTLFVNHFGIRLVGPKWTTSVRFPAMAFHPLQRWTLL